MAAVVFVRNCVAAGIAAALLWLGARWLTPLAAPHLPNPEAVLAALGLAGLLLPIVYKLLVDLFSVVRLGASSPARSGFVSIIAGGSVLALFAAASLFALAHGLEEAAKVAAGAPAAVGLVRTGVLHLNLLTLGVAVVAALFIGSWAGRRHGREATFTVVGVALLGWGMVLAIDVLAGMKTLAEVRAALQALPSSVTHGFLGFVPAAKAANLPLLMGAIVFGLIGVYASGGKTASGAPRALVLAGA